MSARCSHIFSKTCSNAAGRICTHESVLQVSTHNGSGISGSTELTLDYGVYDLTLPTTRDGGSFRGQQTLAKYLPTKRRAPQVDVEVTDAGGRPPTKAKAAQFPASPPKSATEVVALLPKAPAKAKAAEVPAAPPANAKSTQEVQAPPETASLAPASSGQALVGPPPKTAAATVAAAAVAEAAAPKKKVPAKAKEPVPKEAQSFSRRHLVRQHPRCKLLMQGSQPKKRRMFPPLGCKKRPLLLKNWFSQKGSLSCRPSCPLSRRPSRRRSKGPN